MILSLFFELFIEPAMYWVGWGVLKVITLGSYPKKLVSKKEKNSMAVIGFLCVVMIITFFNMS